MCSLVFPYSAEAKPKSKAKTHSTASKTSSSSKKVYVRRGKSTVRSKPSVSYSAQARKQRAFDSLVERSLQSLEAKYSASPEILRLTRSARGAPLINSLPNFNAVRQGRYVAQTTDGSSLQFTLIPSLQTFTELLLEQLADDHMAVVAMHPKSGALLAIAERSRTLSHPALHALYPAASIFKLVTSAGALETRRFTPDTVIQYRGGTYTLNQWNYKPDPRRDRFSMDVSTALGKSCNPVFGRVALNYLSVPTLAHTAYRMGFNRPLDFDISLEPSTAYIPNDPYEFSLTGAGFGSVDLSPVHAAAMASAIANQGVLPRPALIYSIANASGQPVYNFKPLALLQALSPPSAQQLLQMMVSTTVDGTSRKAFNEGGSPVFPNFNVAAKTGTLKGENPAGINNWFVAAAPANNPQIVVAVIVVDPVRISTKASEIGRDVLRYYFSMVAKSAERSP